MLHRRKSASPSFHSPEFLSNVRGVDATVKLATAAPDGVKRSSGSAVRLPITVIVVSPAIAGLRSGLGRVAAHDLRAQHRLVQRQLAVQLLHRVRVGVEIEQGVDALAVLLDLERKPALAPNVDLLDGATRRADDVEEGIQRRSDSALVQTGLEEDHYLVMTHEDHSPPVDSAAT